jgi:hypothetical protein
LAPIHHAGRDGRAEVAAGSEPDVLLEMVVYGLVCNITYRRQANKSSKAIILALDLLGGPIVVIGCTILHLGLVGDPLNARHGQKDDGDPNTKLISQLNFLDLHIPDLTDASRPLVWLSVHVGLVVQPNDRTSHLSGLLESNVANHIGWTEIVVSRWLGTEELVLKVLSW